MSKIDEASILESMFAISLSVLIAKGEIDQASIGRVRSLIESKLFATGYANYPVSDALQIKRGQNPEDTFTVNLTIDMSSKDFDSNYDMLYSRMSDVGNIANKIQSLIENIQTSTSRLKLIDIRNNFLYNDTNDNITFSITSRGTSAIEDSYISGSVYVRAETEDSVSFDNSIPFRVKISSSNDTPDNPYNIIKYLSEVLSISWNDIDKYRYLLRESLSNAERIKRHSLVISMYNKFITKIIADQSDISNRSYQFLSQAMFGSGLSDFISYKGGLTDQEFGTIRTSTRLSVTAVGRDITFIDRSNGVPMFKLKAKIRQLPAAEELSFDLEPTVGARNKLNSLNK